MIYFYRVVSTTHKNLWDAAGFQGSAGGYLLYHGDLSVRYLKSRIARKIREQDILVRLKRASPRFVDVPNVYWVTRVIAVYPNIPCAVLLCLNRQSAQTLYRNRNRICSCIDDLHV